MCHKKSRCNLYLKILSVCSSFMLTLLFNYCMTMRSAHWIKTNDSLTTLDDSMIHLSNVPTIHTAGLYAFMFLSRNKEGRFSCICAEKQPDIFVLYSKCEEADTAQHKTTHRLSVTASFY